MSEIADYIRNLAKSRDEIYSVVCSVVSVDQEKKTATVQPNNGSAEIFDVRLQAVVSGSLGLVYFPKLKSEVLVSFMSKEVAYISLFSEVEKMTLDIGDFSLLFDSKNANLTSENVDIIAQNTEISSDSVKVNAEAVKILSTSFEVEGASVSITAPAIALAGAVSLSGSLSMNGGANGGVPLALPLVEQINSIKNDLKELKIKFNSWVVVSQDGGAGLKTKLATWSPNLQPIEVEQISNPEITQ